MAAMPATIRLAVSCQQNYLASIVPSKAPRSRGKHVTASPIEQLPSKCLTAVSAAATDAPSAVVQDVDFSRSEAQGVTSPESQLAKRMLESQWSLDFVDDRAVDAGEHSTPAIATSGIEVVKSMYKSRGRKRSTASKIEKESDAGENTQPSLTNSCFHTDFADDEAAGIHAVSIAVKPSAAKLRKGKFRGAIQLQRHETLETHAADALLTRLIASSNCSPVCTENEPREGTLLRDYGSHSAPEVDWGVKLPALAKEDEWFLATCVQRGKAMLEHVQQSSVEAVANELQLPSREVQRQLFVAEAAVNKLVQHNTSLVLSIAHRYGAWRRGGDFAAVCHAGLKALVSAARDFKAERKLRFSTFASLLISRAISRSIPTTRFIKGDRREMKSQVDVSGRLSTAPLQRRRRDPVSMYAPSRSVDITWEECLAVAPPGEGSLSAGNMKSVQAAIKSSLQSLPLVEQRILQQRFGLDGCGERTLKEVGLELKLSAEMVRKYEARAVMKLQAETRNTALAQALQSVM